MPAEGRLMRDACSWRISTTPLGLQGMTPLLPILTILLTLGWPVSSDAGLAPRSIQSIVCTPDGGVALTARTQHLWFEADGAFLDGRTYEVDGARLEARVVAVTASGGAWLLATQSGDDYSIKTTRLFQFDPNGQLVSKRAREGGWRPWVDPGGALHLGQQVGTELRVDLVDASGEPVPVLRLEIEADTVDSWALDREGGVWVLTRQREVGRLRHFDVEGQLLAEVNVRPDPMTSVAYVKDVFVDADGGVYASHGSWEVSSAIGDAGSIMSVDPSGGLVRRITGGVGYLQDVVVCGDTLFVVGLGDEVLRFSRDGADLGSFIAVPPEHGETWEERADRRRRAARVGEASPVSDLLTALIYGSYDQQRQARRWLNERGAAALPTVMQAMVVFPRAHQVGVVASTLFESHPEASAAAFLQASPEARRAAAAKMAWAIEAEIPGLEETLLDLALRGDRDARSVLEWRGAPPSLVEKYIAELRAAHRGSESTFHLEWGLKQSWPDAFEQVGGILSDSADPERELFRVLAIEAALYHSEKERKEPDRAGAAAGLRVGMRAWARSEDPFLRETGAVALTALGEPGYEEAALAVGTTAPEMGVAVILAFSELCRRRPDAVESRVDVLLEAALGGATPEKDFNGTLYGLCSMPSPGLARACLEHIRAQELPFWARKQMLFGLDAEVLPREDLLRAFQEPSWQRPLANEYAYSSFAAETLELLAEDPADLRVVKGAVLELLPTAKRNTDSPFMGTPFSDLLRSIRPYLTEDDIPALAPFLDAPDEETRWAVFTALGRLQPTPELQSRLVPLLEDDELGLPAAQALGRVGHPDALPVLAEKGLKHLGFYSHIQLDAASFAPYGRAAEETLLALADYPNRGTRAAVRRILVEMDSDDGAQLVQADFDRAVNEGTFPDSETLALLLEVGRDPLPGLISLAMAQPEALGECGCGSQELADALQPRLESAILAEVDVARAQALGRLARSLLGDSTESWLAGVRTRHPNPEVAAALAADGANR